MIMPRYIDADDLKCKLVFSGAIGEFGVYLIDNQPSVDVAPVVFCRDCVNHEHCSVEDTMSFARLSEDSCI